jgi:hypothetical protein
MLHSVTGLFWGWEKAVNMNIEVQKFRIDLLRRDGGTQPRVAINWDVAYEYGDDMKEGARFPPVIAFFDKAEYWLADGFHRVEGALSIDLEEIEVDVRQGTREDAQWFSFGANRSNGMRRSDKG